MRFPLEGMPEEERKKIRRRFEGKNVVCFDDEPCLTCGHFVRLVNIEKTNGDRILVKRCLYCITRVHTSANKQFRKPKDKCHLCPTIPY